MSARFAKAGFMAIIVTASLILSNMTWTTANAYVLNDEDATASTPVTTPTPGNEKGKISGSVVDKNGDPLKSVKLTLKGENTKISERTKSDASGLFEFNDLEADTYALIARKSGYKTSKTKIELEQGEEEEVEIQMKKKPKSTPTPKPTPYY